MTEADLVNDHDFLTYAIGKAALYGIYDEKENHGFVSIGMFLKEGNTRCSSFLLVQSIGISIIFFLMKKFFYDCTGHSRNDFVTHSSDVINCYSLIEPQR